MIHSLTSEMIATARCEFEKTGYVVLHSVGFADGDIDAIEAIAREFGEPSCRDGARAVWKIAPSKQIGTFSEIAGEAAMHTDSAYHAQPESAIMLACERAATDGGDSLILPFSALWADLVQAASHRDAPADVIDHLHASIWSWKVPDVFRGGSAPNISPPAPILYADGRVRWRRDNLVVHRSNGFTVANWFTDFVERSTKKVRIRLERGDVLVCDNTRILHGRTMFRDSKRLMYRVRFI